jgi:hypothetical protein
MRNHIKLVEEVITRKNKGYPTGVDDTSLKQIPILLKRIEELENALAPFARVASRFDSNTQELVDVYAKDCREAFSALDLSDSIQLRPQEILYPAEG